MKISLLSFDCSVLGSLPRKPVFAMYGTLVETECKVLLRSAPEPVSFLVQKHILQEKLSNPIELSDFVNFFLSKSREHFVGWIKARFSKF